jgi:uncharacterized membrane protein
VTLPGRPSQAELALVRQAELVIAFILRAGVVVSGAIIAVGVLIYYVRAATGHRLPADTIPHTLHMVTHGLATGDPLAIIALGLLLLLLTPVIRVAVSIGAFAIERDWRYVAITTVVLVILIISFLLGKGGA